ncbi:MAG: DnaJ domain-containing protein [Chromatiaceae bacterium]|nr:DnaJ domain-containing protein [Chromatiaceae bacterium]
MTRLVLLIALLFVLWWLRRWWRITAPEQRRRRLGQVALWGGLALLLLALLSGRLSPLLALLGGAIALLVRLAAVARQLSLFQGLWRARRGGQGPRAPSSEPPLDRAEACAILGVAPDADPETIRAAHRRLMLRLHPDRGGSDYLAARINAARRILLDE